MSVKQAADIKDLLKGREYVGRGIIMGQSEGGKSLCAAYFISGRSANSRNRVFTMRDGVLFTEPFDASRVEDPSLILYPAVKRAGGALVVTNGDHTLNVCAAVERGEGLFEAQRERVFEPDAPNFTPRISGVLPLSADGKARYSLGIIKSGDGCGGCCERCEFDYEATAGLGHIICTYMHNGSPLPSFEGEPWRVKIPESADEFADDIWNALDPENRISLFVRYIDISTGKENDIIINKNRVG